MALTTKDFETRFTAWALDNPDFRAALVVGSQARTDHPADDCSDLDLVLFLENLERYRDQLDWVQALAPVWVSIFSYTVAGEPERLVLYEGGLQVDFVFNPAAALQGAAQMLQSNQIPDTVHRGVRLLFDKNQLIPFVPAPGKPPPPQPPSHQQVQAAWEHFWFAVIHAAKQLHRGDLPFYKKTEQDVRQLLLPFLEWRSRAANHWVIDTWHNGKFIHEWLDQDLYNALVRSYTPLETDISWHGLLELVRLFSQCAEETAAAIGMEYPHQIEKKLLSCLENLKPGYPSVGEHQIDDE